MKNSSSKDYDTLLFVTRAPRITEVLETDGVYSLFGRQIDIPELTNEEPL